ncbi:type IV pilus modification protein PilV [Nitrincola alkalisediminis]|uniref:type IV pilus modification protein PilV n=1 Tax=Nitrincola alkalisediminis TaxID=1366656 RepID=UPI001875C38D|nr:type IV pilus modification protein PilV [Nitrincola alkalisediminis]
MRHQTNPSQRRQKGATLLEVLIATVVISIGLLGLAGLQVKSVQNNYNAYVRSQASLLASDLAERMRAAPQQTADTYLINSFPNLAEFNALDCGTVDNLDLDTAAKDLLQWRRSVFCLLPEGNARVTRSALNNNVINIDIRWSDPRSGNATETLSYTTEI